MTWDLATAKAYLEIDPGDTTKDSQIQLTMDTALSSIETALQRGLLFRRQTVVYHSVTSLRLYLPRFPLATIHEVKDGNDAIIESWQAHQRSGWIEFLGVLPSPVSVDYDGGYQILPADLERAMWEVFMQLWSRTNQVTGGPPAEGEPGVAAGAEEVRSLTVFDGFKVDYGVQLSEQGLLAQDQHEWGWLAPWAPVLAFYRSEHGVGLGVV